MKRGQITVVQNCLRPKVAAWSLTRLGKCEETSEGERGHPNSKNLAGGLLLRLGAKGGLLGDQREGEYLCQGTAGEVFLEMGVVAVLKNPRKGDRDNLK